MSVEFPPHVRNHNYHTVIKADKSKAEKELTR
jgi:hypothetical protein